jgi:cold shock CspA family protein
MLQGTVLWYDPNLGYGFIHLDHPEVRGPRKIFVQHTGIAGDKALETGDRVGLSEVRGEQGIEAVNVVLLAESAASSYKRLPKVLRPGSS